MADLSKLLETLRRVEALHARTDVAGERDATATAMDAIRRQLDRLKEDDPDEEYKFSLSDDWSRRLMIALMRRYGIEPFRFRGQRRTTVMARVPQSFVDQTLWPEFCELDDVLRSHLADVTDRMIREAIYEGSSDVDVRNQPAAIEDARKQR
jgi:hypothetical protein